MKTSIRQFAAALLFVVTAAAGLFTASPAQAQECRKIGEACVEGRETRNINGNMITKDCWRFRDTYECNGTNVQDFCAALEAQPECVQINASCIKTKPDGSCEIFRKNFRCSERLTPQPTNTVLLNESYTITRDELNTSQCQQFTDNPSCRSAGRTCVEGPETRNIDGAQVYKDCWRFREEFTCTVDSGADFCAPLITAGCREVGTPTCVMQNAAGVCQAFTHDYVCANRQDPPPQEVMLIDERVRVQSDRINDDTCAAARDSSCTLASNTCTGRGTGSCFRYTKKPDGSFTCQDYIVGPSSEGPSERANPTVVSGTLDTFIELKASSCQEFTATGIVPRAGGGNTLSGYNCKTRLTPVSTTQGINYFDGNCNEFKKTYACPDIDKQNSCGSLSVDPKCTLVDTKCDNFQTGPNGQQICTDTQKTFKCEVKPAQTTQKNECTEINCVGGICQEAEAEPNRDFGTAVAGLEVARQAAAYQDIESLKIFNGQNDKCSVKLFGVSNCCKREPGGGDFTNSAQALAAGIEVGREVLEVGSEYIYDMLAGNSLQTSFAPVVGFFSRGAEGAAVFNPEISAYGFTLGVNTRPAASGLLGDIAILKDLPFGETLTNIPGLTTASSLSTTVVLEIPGILGGAGTTFYVAFDPATLAWQIAFQLIMQALQCDQSEQILALKKGRGLCHQVGERYCSSKFFGTCVEKKESYCCYNSKLAKIIAVQGGAQVGKSFGSPKNADCSGLTVAQLESVDFSKIDMTEFIDDIKEKALSGTFGNSTGRGVDGIESKIQEYFGSDYERKVPLAPGMGSLVGPPGRDQGGNPALGGRGTADGQQGQAQ